jgi:LacI family transcriptional regulator
MRPTIRDVAQTAGVSIKTVSRVLNGERYVRGDTRERVQTAVAALGFHPSVAARSLGGRRSFQIGFICDNPNPYYTYEVQTGIRDRLADAGVRLLAQPYDREAGNLAQEIHALINATHVDGLILTPPVSDRADVLHLLRERDIAFVRIQPGREPTLAPSVAIDNRAAARAMVSRLMEQGHGRIGFIGGPADFAVSAERLAGYHDALDAGGIEADPALIAAGDFGFDSGVAAARQLLGQAPTAIFAASDAMAAGVLAEAHRRGLSLPRDLSVCGFDDSSLGSSVWPPLTTVRQPLRDIGWQAADLLLDPANEYTHRVLPFTIVERASTGQAAPDMTT